MAKVVSDGLARLQNQSRIPANTWRQWCSLLQLDPIDAVDVWEEICYPILVATRKLPEIPFILQMRAARLDLDIFDFKEEAPKPLHVITFLYALKDPRLITGKIKSSVLKFYKKAANESAPGKPPNIFIQQFIKDLCSAILVAKVLPASNITLSGALTPVLDGRATVKQVVQLGLKALNDQPYADIVRECLNMPDLLNAETAAAAESPGEGAAPGASDDDDDDDYDDDDYDDDYDDDDEEEEEEEDDGEEEEDDDYDDYDDDEDDDDDDDEDDDDYGDEDGDVNDGFEDDDDGDQFDIFLLRFKTALHAVYEAEAKNLEDPDDQQAADREEDLLEERLKAITLFKPLQATIPSIEEAQTIARRAEASQNVVRTHKPTLGVSGGARSSGGSSSSGGGGGGSSQTSSSSAQSLSGGDRAAMIVKSEGKGEGAGKGGGPTGSRSGSTGLDSAGLIQTGGVDTGIEVNVGDMVEPEQVSLPELSGKVHQIGRLLAVIEPLDQAVWSLFLDPVETVKDCHALSRTLGTADTGTANAYQAIKQIACYLPMKHLLHISEQFVRRNRNFTVEVSGFINNVKNNREFSADSRQLAPLPGILDHAVGALIRLEALKTNFKFSRELPDQYARETVTLYYEEALRSLTDMSNPELRQKARQRADMDTSQLLEAFEAEKFVAQMLETVRSYALAIREAEGCDSVDALKAAIAEWPLEFVDVETASSEEVPADLLLASGLGEIFDEMYRYVAVQAWAVMGPAHKPPETLGRLREGLREIMVSSFVVTPEMKRHQERAKIGLSVISLDKISGTPSLRDFFVRVREDGRIAYLRDFEDGSYVDLFELRQYQPSRVHHVAKKKADEGQNDELQTGRKYLFTVGRTNHLFGESPSELINGCIRSEEGGPKIFPVF